jgi:hypothetical protein
LKALPVCDARGFVATKPKNVKERVAKQKSTDKSNLHILIQAALTRLQQSPDIVRGFFRHRECRAAI